MKNLQSFFNRPCIGISMIFSGFLILPAIFAISDYFGLPVLGWTYIIVSVAVTYSLIRRNELVEDKSLSMVFAVLFGVLGQVFVYAALMDELGIFRRKEIAGEN